MVEMKAVPEKSLTERVQYTRNFRKLLENIANLLKNEGIREIYLFYEGIAVYSVVIGEAFGNQIKVHQYRHRNSEDRAYVPYDDGTGGR